MTYKTEATKFIKSLSGLTVKEQVDVLVKKFIEIEDKAARDAIDDVLLLAEKKKKSLQRYEDRHAYSEHAGVAIVNRMKKSFNRENCKTPMPKAECDAGVKIRADTHTISNLKALQGMDIHAGLVGLPLDIYDDQPKKTDDVADGS